MVVFILGLFEHLHNLTYFILLSYVPNRLFYDFKQLIDLKYIESYSEI